MTIENAFIPRTQLGDCPEHGRTKFMEHQLVGGEWAPEPVWICVQCHNELQLRVRAEQARAMREAGNVVEELTFVPRGTTTGKGTEL